jgi:hypothetical protein
MGNNRDRPASIIASDCVEKTVNTEGDIGTGFSSRRPEPILSHALAASEFVWILRLDAVGCQSFEKHQTPFPGRAPQSRFSECWLRNVLYQIRELFALLFGAFEGTARRKFTGIRSAALDARLLNLPGFCTRLELGALVRDVMRKERRSATTAERLR